MKPIIIGIAFILFAALCIVVLTGSHIEDRPVVTMVYDGEKGDFGYNDLAYLGLIRARDDFHLKTREITWTGTTQKSDPVIDPDTGEKSDVVLLIGDSLSGLAKDIKDTYPGVPVVIIDAGPVQGDTIRSISFTMYGASYIAGTLAANLTGTGKIGVIAGKPAPVITSFIDGFVAGAQRSSPGILITITYLADDNSGFRMPEKAGMVAETMYRNGTDVIFTVAGGSGPGAISAAKRLPGLYIIGVDTDQSALGPGVVVASVVKNLDEVVYREIKNTLSGSFTPGAYETGLSDGGTRTVVNPRFNNLSVVVARWSDEAAQREGSARFPVS